MESWPVYSALHIGAGSRVIVLTIEESIKTHRTVPRQVAPAVNHGVDEALDEDNTGVGLPGASKVRLHNLLA